MSEYDENVDYKFLDAMGITYKLYQPWQLGLFHEEFDGKFMWYPTRGTLMVEYGLKFKGYDTQKIGEYHDTETVYNMMMKIVAAKLKQ